MVGRTLIKTSKRIARDVTDCHPLIIGGRNNERHPSTTAATTTTTTTTTTAAEKNPFGEPVIETTSYLSNISSALLASAIDSTACLFGRMDKKKRGNDRYSGTHSRTLTHARQDTRLHKSWRRRRQTDRHTHTHTHTQRRGTDKQPRPFVCLSVCLFVCLFVGSLWL